MIKIENEKLIPKFLADAARKYCETVGGTEIYNVAILGEGDYRIMYRHLTTEGKPTMSAVLLKMPIE